MGDVVNGRRCNTPHTLHAVPHYVMAVEREGGKGYYYGRQEKEWMDCLKNDL